MKTQIRRLHRCLLGASPAVPATASQASDTAHLGAAALTETEPGPSGEATVGSTMRDWEPPDRTAPRAKTTCAAISGLRSASRSQLPRHVDFFLLARYR